MFLLEDVGLHSYLEPIPDLDRDDDLASELNAPRWKPTPRGQILLEPKEATKARLGRSPDSGDALVLAFAKAGVSPETLPDTSVGYVGDQWSM